MAQVSSGDFPKSFFRGDCGLDSKCSLKKGCRSVCASDRADQVREKVAFGEDTGSKRAGCKEHGFGFTCEYTPVDETDEVG